MKSPTYSIQSPDRESTAEEGIRTSAKDITSDLERYVAAVPQSMDYQWYEVPTEEFISLIAVCSLGEQN